MATVLNIAFMAKNKLNLLHVTNRDFLRNYKLFKQKLASNEVSKIIIEENGHAFEFSCKKKSRTGSMKEMTDFFRKNKGKFHIERVPLQVRF